MSATDLSGLLAGEFRELGTELETLAGELEAGSERAAARCIDLCQRVAQVGELIEAAPLQGFAEFLVANVPALSASRDARRLTTWPRLIGRCLEDTQDDSAWRELADWLTSAEWAVPFEREDALELERELKSLVRVEDERADAEFAPITEQDLSLRPSADATPQTLEAFLREAPQQAARLSRCLGALDDTGEASERAAEACRLAHTLKGSAGLLGVGVIGHLAHALEAALQGCPPEEWSRRLEGLECLQEAGDMMEALIELTVSGESAPDGLIELVERLRRLSSDALRRAEPRPEERPDGGRDSSRAGPAQAPPEAARSPDPGAPGPAAEPSPSEPGNWAADAERPESYAWPLADVPPSERPLADSPPPGGVPAGDEPAGEAAAHAPPADEGRDGDHASGREVEEVLESRPPGGPGFGQFEATLAVPVRIVDDNLQRAGEINVQIAQLQTRVAGGVSRLEQLNERLQQVQARVHELETFVDTRMTPAAAAAARGEGAEAATEAFDPLELDQYNALHSIGGVLAEAVQDSRELAHELGDELGAQQSLLAQHGRFAKELGGSIMAARLVSVATIVPRLERIARQTARRLERKVELSVEHHGLSIDTDILDGLVEPLMHALRNAIDHGIEPAEQRTASGKPPEGRIRLEFRRAGNRIEVVCSDDGRGLDLEAVAERARNVGLIPPAASPTDKELLQYVFAPGLSTRTDATEISGRGIGMDSIRHAVERLKGTVQLDSRAGEGCVLTFRLPMNLSSTHVLFVRVGEAVYGIPATAVDRVVHSDAGEVSVFGAEATFSFESLLCPLHSLAALLGQAEPELAELAGKPRPLVLVHGDTGPVALVVDRAFDSREVLIQDLGKTLPELPGIAGGCILPDGAVAVMLEVGELLRAPLTAEVGEAPALAPQPVPGQRCALVVDDSLSARRALAELLEDAGFRVETAVDGLDAIDRLADVEPHVVLVDLEMPRMNGLELTSHLRGSGAWSSLPIVMITSRATAKHTQQAMAAGVSAYVTKPYSEDDLVDRLRELVAGAPAQPAGAVR